MILIIKSGAEMATAARLRFSPVSSEERRMKRIPRNTQRVTQLTRYKTMPTLTSTLGCSRASSDMSQVSPETLRANATIVMTRKAIKASLCRAGREVVVWIDSFLVYVRKESNGKETKTTYALESIPKHAINSGESPIELHTAAAV